MQNVINGVKKPDEGTQLRALYDCLSDTEWRTQEKLSILCKQNGLPKIWPTNYNELRKKGLIVTRRSDHRSAKGRPMLEHKRRTDKDPFPQGARQRKKKTKTTKAAPAPCVKDAKDAIAQHLIAIEKIVDNLEESIKASLIEKMFDQL